MNTSIFSTTKITSKLYTFFLGSIIISSVGFISPNVLAINDMPGTNYDINSTMSTLPSSMNIMSSSAMTGSVASSVISSSTAMPVNRMTPDSKIVTTAEFKGDISRIENNKLFVTKDDVTKEYTVPAAISIKKDSFNSSLQNLKVGDSLTVRESNNGSIISIDAISSQVFDYSKFLIPGVIVALLALCLGYYFYNKSNKGHIQTNNATRN